MVQVCVICPTLERTQSARTKSSGLFFLSRVRFSPKAKSRSINWELAPESIIQVAWWFSFMVHDNVIGSSDPKSCVEAREEIGAKVETGAEVEAEAEAEAEVENTTEDDTAAEEIRKVAERHSLRRERRRAELD